MAAKRQRIDTHRIVVQCASKIGQPHQPMPARQGGMDRDMNGEVVRCESPVAKAAVLLKLYGTLEELVDRARRAGSASEPPVQVDRASGPSLDEELLHDLLG
jgi:hypothetical protein